MKTAIFLSHYKRQEYTEKCLASLKEAQEYPDCDFYVVEDDNPNMGLRNRVIDFFNEVVNKDYDLLAKMDNDCTVPKNWLNDIIEVFKNTDVDILSPNVFPSNAAFQYGKEDKNNKWYRPAELVGGLWIMKASLIKDIYFEKCGTVGLSGATTLLRQIITEKEPKIGWVPNVTVQDIGHWSGNHPEHIKSLDHELYSKEIGRQLAWSAK